MATSEFRWRQDPLSPPADAFPTPEFLDLLAFNFDEACIWLGDRRMMMIDVSLFGELRRHLIDGLGVDAARRVFTKLGYESGLRDAKLQLSRWPDIADRGGAAAMSPHRFQGFTKLKVIFVDRDERARILRGEWQWLQSVEANAHVSAYGRAAEPTCWMELGYATGYSYGVFGTLTLFEEIGCRAMGNEVCTVRGQCAEFCDDLDERLKYFEFLEPLIPDRRPSQARAAAGGAAAGASYVAADGATARMDTAAAAAPAEGTIVGTSPALTAAKQLLESVAPTSATVLISGESGVGKELFTRNLHALSARAAKPFVAVNCAAIPDTLIEAELFGVERGAFTGAIESRPGRFERAHEGTLFLDEIGLLNPAAQVKLLRVIQEREVERIGGVKPIKVDVRIVAAHTVPLRQLVDHGEFREDLFYRLNVFPIHVPPLRERREDIPALLAHYLAYYNRVHNRNIARFTFDAIKALLNYHYPGNIRELQNLVERAVILTKGDAIDVWNVFAYGESFKTTLCSPDADGKLTVDGRGVDPLAHLRESRLIEVLGEEASANDGYLSWPSIEGRLFARLARNVLAEENGNVSAAARRLGMKRHQFEYRLKAMSSPTSSVWSAERPEDG